MSGACNKKCYITLWRVDLYWPIRGLLIILVWSGGAGLEPEFRTTNEFTKELEILWFHKRVDISKRRSSSLPYILSFFECWRLLGYFSTKWTWKRDYTDCHMKHNNWLRSKVRHAMDLFVHCFSCYLCWDAIIRLFIVLYEKPSWALNAKVILWALGAPPFNRINHECWLSLRGYLPRTRDRRNLACDKFALYNFGRRNVWTLWSLGNEHLKGEKSFDELPKCGRM